MSNIIYACNLIVDLIDINDQMNEGIITNYLSAVGFDEDKIDQLLAIIDVKKGYEITAMRIFSREEKARFHKDTLIYLNKVYLSGILDLITLDEIMDKAIDENAEIINVTIIKEMVLSTLIQKKHATIINNENKNNLFQ